MRYLFAIMLFACVFTSCSDYQNVFKSEDIALKFKVGDSLFEQGKYEKANRLFAQIVPKYKGKPQAQKLMYLYSKSFFEMKDYYVSGYQFERFVASYPKSEKKEEAAFLSAKSYYMLSPRYSKDQKETRDAIGKLQDFINLYPNSKYLSETNKLIKELDYKLEKKAFEIAKQYDHISDYKASIKSFDNFIYEFPGSTLREDALFFRLDAAYKLAINSVELKRTNVGVVKLKKVRLLQAKEYFDVFKKAYANSKYIADAEDMFETINKELETYSVKS